MTNSENLANGDWHGLVVYQIYPRSFNDSNSDGIGDLQGIIKKLDHLAGSENSLGIDAIWLSPFYPSPMADFGYDVADYCDVDPMFGTLEDFKELLLECHERNVKVIIDLVPNHTSSEHTWFKQSRKSKNNKYADWYIWRDGMWPDPRDQNKMLPPNNWRDALSGDSAWEWDETRQQFYLHSFDKGQPDLNWSNPAVRKAMTNVMRFWLDLGVDGFRVDAVYWMAKEPLLSDDDYNTTYVEGESLKYSALMHNNSQGWPVVYAYLSEMADVLKETKYADKQRFMVTEAYPPDQKNKMAAYMSFYVGMDPKVAAPFNFEGLSLPFEAGAWSRFLKVFHNSLENFSSECVASYAFGNHDQPRLASRLGKKSARAAAVILLTLPGIAFIYNGEELGLEDVEIPSDKVQDPAAKGNPLTGIGRDPERTPMLWNKGVNAGFSKATPWLPLSPDWKSINAEVQLSRPDSFLNLYRSLIHLRKAAANLRKGKIEVLDAGSPYVLSYKRYTASKNEFVLVLVNFSDSKIKCRLGNQPLKLLLSSDYSREVDPSKVYEGLVNLLPHEATVFGSQESNNL